MLTENTLHMNDPKQRPEYYVISPNFHDDIDKDIQNKIRFLTENKVIAIGHMAGRSSDRFEKLKAGDRIICAHRKNFKWTYYFIGVIQTNEKPKEKRWTTIPEKKFPGASWEEFMKNFMRENDWTEEDIKNNFEFDKETGAVLEHFKIQYRELDNFSLLSNCDDEILNDWSGNKKKDHRHHRKN